MFYNRGQTAVTQVTATEVANDNPVVGGPMGSNPNLLKINVQLTAPSVEALMQTTTPTASGAELDWTAISKFTGGPASASILNISTYWVPNAFKLNPETNRYTQVFQYDVPTKQEIQVGQFKITATFTYKKAAFKLLGATLDGFDITDISVSK
jgi:hypothetical protein